MSGTVNDHRRTVQGFLRTDRHRLVAALERQEWHEEVVERVIQHLRLLLQVQRLFLEGRDPHAPELRAELAALRPDSLDAAVETLNERMAALATALDEVAAARLEAQVLDPHERGLTLLGHLYELCRANTMLIGWLEGYVAPASEGGIDSVADWFELPEEP